MVPPRMAVIDWVIVGFYIASAITIGAWFTRRASKSTSDFFVAGRSLGWFVAGTSIVATTFAADTPVFIAGMTRDEGIFSNWFWWSILIGQVATATVFARLWRRSEVITDVEFVKLRYGDGPRTRFLRVFKSLLQGVGKNCMVMAAVTLAMVKVVQVLLGIEPGDLFLGVDATWVVLGVLGLVALLYSALSGLYGVVYTDIIQFALAMIGSIGLAVIAYVDASSGDGMMARLAAAPDFKETLLHFVPRFETFDIAAFAFVVYIIMLWWASAPGSGYAVQRLLATRTERDARLAFLWYAFCHYVLRPWPWIIVGLLSLIYFPGIEDPERAFPLMIDHFLPVGLKGAMVAAMLAAYMSTMDTHLNWGASYIVNDVYEPYVRPGRGQREYVMVARITMVVLTALAVLVATELTSILDAFKFLAVFAAGLGTVMIARWFWWRVNALTEIVAIAATIIVAGGTLIWLPDVIHPDGTKEDMFAARVLVSTVAVTAVWLPVALFYGRINSATVAFHKKMQVGGPGWRAVGPTGNRASLGRDSVEWAICTVCLFSLLLGSGKLLFHQWVLGGGLLAVGVVTGYLLLLVMRTRPEVAKTP